MKKIFTLLLVSALVFTGCEKVGNTYKQGVFEGSVIDNYGGEENTATAKITVDENGKITEVYLDTTYTKDGVKTTKKALGKDYGMKVGNSPYGSAELEWDEQVVKLEQYVIANQGIDNLNLDNDGKTDAVSGCTIKIDALYKALEEALTKAKN